MNPKNELLVNRLTRYIQNQINLESTKLNTKPSVIISHTIKHLFSKKTDKNIYTDSFITKYRVEWCRIDYDNGRPLQDISYGCYRSLNCLICKLKGLPAHTDRFYITDTERLIVSETIKILVTSTWLDKFIVEFNANIEDAKKWYNSLHKIEK